MTVLMGVDLMRVDGESGELPGLGSAHLKIGEPAGGGTDDQKRQRRGDCWTAMPMISAGTKPATVNCASARAAA